MACASASHIQAAEISSLRGLAPQRGTRFRQAVALGYCRPGALASARIRLYQPALEHIVADLPPDGHAVVDIESEVDAKINPAHPIVLLRLGQRRKATRPTGAHVAVVVPGDTVQFIRDEGKCDLVGSIKATQAFEDRAAQDCMARRIARERRREVGRAIGVARWRAQRSPGQRSGAKGAVFP